MVHKKVFGARALALAVLLGLGSASAQAVTVTYTFDTTKVAAFGAAPYGTVKLVENGSNVDVTVKLRSDLDFVVTGGPHTIFTFNATGIVVGDITDIVFFGVPVSGGTLTVVQDPDAQANPFGRFLFGIDCVDIDKDKCAQGGSGPWVDPLTFTVLNATADDFAYRSFMGKDTDPWVSSADGYFFGADAICVGEEGVGCTGATGSIAVSQPGDEQDDDNDVPEPGTLALLGLGLMGLGMSRRRHA